MMMALVTMLCSRLATVLSSPRAAGMAAMVTGTVWRVNVIATRAMMETAAVKVSDSFVIF